MEKAPLQKIFRQLFMMFEKYGDKLILYCHSENSNRIACQLSEKQTPSSDELKLLEIVKNIFGVNHLNKLQQMQQIYYEYKKNGSGTIKLSLPHGKIFSMSIQEIMGQRPNIVESISKNMSDVHRKIPYSSARQQFPIQTKTEPEISEESYDPYDSDESESTLSGGKKASKKSKRAKKAKKSAKKKMKKTPKGVDAKNAKMKAKNAKKKASLTPEGQIVKQKRKKVKDLEATGDSDELRIAREELRESKKYARRTKEGQNAVSAHKIAKEAKREMKETPEGQEYIRAKKDALKAKKEKRKFAETQSTDEEAQSILGKLERGKHMIMGKINDGIDGLSEHYTDTIQQMVDIPQASKLSQTQRHNDETTAEMLTLLRQIYAKLNEREPIYSETSP